MVRHCGNCSFPGAGTSGLLGELGGYIRGCKGGQEEVCRWCVVSEVAGYGLACCMVLRDFMMMTLEKQCLFLSGVFALIGRNVALLLKLGGEQEEDEMSPKGNPGWCGTSVARGEGATGGGEEMLVKAAHEWEVWLCSMPRCGEKWDYSPRWL